MKVQLRCFCLSPTSLFLPFVPRLPSTTKLSLTRSGEARKSRLIIDNASRSVTEVLEVIPLEISPTALALSLTLIRAYRRYKLQRSLMRVLQIAH